MKLMLSILMQLRKVRDADEVLSSQLACEKGHFSRSTVEFLWHLSRLLCLTIIYLADNVIDVIELRLLILKHKYRLFL